MSGPLLECEKVPYIPDMVSQAVHGTGGYKRGLTPIKQHA